MERRHGWVGVAVGSTIEEANHHHVCHIFDWIVINSGADEEGINVIIESYTLKAIIFESLLFISIADVALYNIYPLSNIVHLLTSTFCALHYYYPTSSTTSPRK